MLADKGHVVVASWEAGSREHLAGTSAVYRQDGEVPMLVGYRDIGRRSLGKQRDNLRTIRGIGDQKNLVGRLEVNDHVVDNAAVGVADQGVLRLPRADLAK